MHLGRSEEAIMRHKLFWIAPLALIGITVFVFLGGFVVEHLWNWLTPALFGWKLITFWQALGLLVLSRILFGNFGIRGGGGGMRGRMGERWGVLTPEEKARVRARIRFKMGFGDTEPPAM